MNNKKNYVLITLFAVMSNLIFAQNKDLQCIYQASNVIPQGVLALKDEKIKQAVIAQLSSQTTFYTMSYSKGKYMFEAQDSNTPLKTVGGENAVYLDLNANLSISQANILERSFIIKEELKKYEWNILSETKEIAGKKCIKAQPKNNTSVTAWFTADIPLGFGPMGYYGLPGLILQLETATKIYTLQKMVYPKESPSMMPPSKGKEISRAEFDALLKKKKEEMGADDSKQGQVKIIRM